MVCVGLLTTIRISGTATLRGWVVLDAGLGTAGLELIDVSGDFDWVSEPAVPVLGVCAPEPAVAVLGVWDSDLAVSTFGVWDSEPVDDWDGVSAPGVPALGVSDSEPVWALAGKASIAPRAATLRKWQCLRKADRRICPPRPNALKKIGNKKTSRRLRASLPAAKFARSECGCRALLPYWG